MGLFDKATEVLKGAVEKATQTAAAGAGAAKSTADKVIKKGPTPGSGYSPEGTVPDLDVTTGAAAGAAAGAPAPAAPAAAPAKKAPAKKPATKKPAAKKAAPKYRTVTVKSGDTLSEIAAKHGVDWREMAELNKLENPDLIFPGQVFKIPNK